MLPTPVRHRISDVAELREMIGRPSEVVVRKQLPALDAHCQAFVAHSPFVLLGTADADGRCDVSPKGDRPGFVLVLDETTLVIPDRPGNRRVDSLQNILVNPHVGLLFLIPGMDETLRVNGTAVLTRDDVLLERMAVDGKQPLLGVVVDVEEAFLHCGKSFLRSQLWSPEQFMHRSELPTLARMVIDQTSGIDPTAVEYEEVVAQTERGFAEAYRCLY